MTAVNIIAGDRYKAPYAGEEGNASQWSGYHKMPAAGNIGDTIELCEVPAGARIDGYKRVNTAHGTGATLAIGWKYKDGSAGGSATAIAAAADVAAAGNTVAAILPITFDKPAIVYVTNAVAAIPQNGEVYVAVTGEYVGTK